LILYIYYMLHSKWCHFFNGLIFKSFKGIFRFSLSMTMHNLACILKCTKQTLLPDTAKWSTFLWTFKLDLGSTQTCRQWITRSISLGVRQPRHEADQSTSSSATVQNEWRSTSIPLFASKTCTTLTHTHTHRVLMQSVFRAILLC
jgi:hypothetical protein